MGERDCAREQVTGTGVGAYACSTWHDITTVNSAAGMLSEFDCFAHSPECMYVICTYVHICIQVHTYVHTYIQVGIRRQDPNASKNVNPSHPVCTRTDYISTYLYG